MGCCAYLHAKIRRGFPVIPATGWWGGLFGKARSGERGRVHELWGRPLGHILVLYCHCGVMGCCAVAEAKRE